MDNERKLNVLTAIAARLNKAGVTWAVGGSMLLYFKEITSGFHDIDLMVLEEDAPRVKELLLQMGELEQSASKPQYTTKVFLEFVIDGVEVDVMAGFGIVKDDVAHDCSLLADDISYIKLHQAKIPLQSLASWRRNYALMGKTDKVKLIDDAMKTE